MVRLVSLILGGSLLAFGQSSQSAQTIYRNSADSIFLVYVNDSSGNPTALGSAFLVAKKTLITNEHVAREGNLVLAVGPVQVPVRVIRVDSGNDLALLATDIELTSKPLTISTRKMSPGERVFAIGNPEGLEKTISDGIISGVRDVDGRKLLQITSPISHGSSGGPIFNADGDVIGVAVGMLKEGQNLNFAVPSEYVHTLIERKGTADVSTLSASDALTKAHRLLAQVNTDEYSDDKDSPYQQHVRDLRAAMISALSTASDDATLREIACLGTKRADLSDQGIDAARRLFRLRPTAENKALLAYVLFDKAQNEDINVAFGKEGSDDVLQAKKRRDTFLDQARQEASEVGSRARPEATTVADFVLAGYHAQQSDYLQAIPLHSYVANSQINVCENDLVVASLRQLITESAQVGHADEAEKWFRTYASKYQPAAYEWDGEGDRRAAARDYANAADAYERAANSAGNYYGYDYCYASMNRSFQHPSQKDAVLANGRKCIDASVSSSNGQFKSALPLVYRLMADVLEERGVYDGALNYIKESLSMKPDDPFTLFAEATVFEDLQRPSECIAAAQSAIRVSDGKYPYMQALLGNCYFDSSDWSHAAASFRLAAEADASDSASAFNLGLSLTREGYNSDAQPWFREALKRNPGPELKAKILNALR